MRGLTGRLTSVLLIASVIFSIALIQPCRSFAVPAANVQNPKSSTTAPDNAEIGHRKSKRRRIKYVLKNVPKATKKFAAGVGLTIALWRGPMVQPSNAAPRSSRGEAIVAPNAKLLAKPGAIKGTVALTGSSLAVLTGVKLEKRRRKDPKRSRMRHLRREKAEKLKKLKRLSQIRQELEFLLEDATNTELPLMDEKFVEARRQPKSPEEEDFLAARYAAILSLSDRAYQILLDLGMIEESFMVDIGVVFKLLEDQ